MLKVDKKLRKTFHFIDEEENMSRMNETILVSQSALN